MSDILALHALTSDAPNIANAMLDEYGTAEAVLDRIDRGLDLLSSRWAGHADDARTRVEACTRQAQQLGVSILTREHPSWPNALADLGDRQPLALYARGNIDSLSTWGEATCLTGARSSTALGDNVTGILAGYGSTHAIPLVTGGAYGIDIAAVRNHRAASVTPQIIVLPSGLDRLYPVGNADLIESVIGDSAVVVSEHPLGAAPHRTRFIARTGLLATAKVTVIVEAAMRSGSLAAAHAAARLGRAVGAVPGPITSAGSAGCHDLIRKGIATLITNGPDVDALRQ